jgi:hypothetical protein
MLPIPLSNGGVPQQIPSRRLHRRTEPTRGKLGALPRPTAYSGPLIAKEMLYGRRRLHPPDVSSDPATRQTFELPFATRAVDLQTNRVTK